MPGVPFVIPIPPDCTIFGASVCSQGGSVDATGTLLLTNAIDITWDLLIRVDPSGAAHDCLVGDPLRCGAGGDDGAGTRRT